MSSRTMSRVIWQHIPFVDEDVIVGRGGRSSHNDLWNSQGGDFFSTFSSPDSFVSFTITSVWQIGCWHFQTLAGFKLFSTFPGFWFPQQQIANLPTLKIKKLKAHPTYQQSRFIQVASIWRRVYDFRAKWAVKTFWYFEFMHILAALTSL